MCPEMQSSGQAGPAGRSISRDESQGSPYPCAKSLFQVGNRSIGSISWQVQFQAGYVMVSQDIRRRVPRDRWLPIGESRTCRPRTSYGRVCVPEARADLRRTTSMSARAPQVGQTRSALAWPELQPEGARCQIWVTVRQLFRI